MNEFIFAAIVVVSVVIIIGLTVRVSSLLKEIDELNTRLGEYMTKSHSLKIEVSDLYDSLYKAKVKMKEAENLLNNKI